MVGVVLERPTRKARVAVEQVFSRAFRAEFGARPEPSHPRAVDLVWRVSGGSLGAIRRETNRALREAAARGYLIDLGAIACRWSASGRAA